MTASKSNDENKPTTARVAERNAYQLTGKRKLTSRQMKFKLQLRKAKAELRKVIMHKSEELGGIESGLTWTDSR